MTTTELMLCIGQVNDSYILEAGNAANPRVNHNRMKRSLFIAAAAAILLLLVGCTVAYILHSDMMETILGKNGTNAYLAETVRGLYEPGGERTELNERLAKKYINPYIFPVEGTIADGDTKLTALSCITDRASCTAAVYLKLENPPPYEIYNSSRILFDWKGKWDGWYIYPTAVGQNGFIGRCFIDKASSTEETLYCVIVFSCEATCTELSLQIGDRPEKIAIPLPGKTGLPDITLENGGIQLTPFGMKIRSALLEQDDTPNTVNPHELAIQYEDGSEYLVQHTGFADEDSIGYTYGMALNTSLENRVYVFNRVVDIRKVTAIRINDHIYPV